MPATVSDVSAVENGQKTAHYEIIALSESQSIQGTVAQAIDEKRAPPELTWANVNFSAGKKKILEKCWGRVTPGQVCAIMGGSGAGKSSLLNVLAGRSSASSTISISGKVTVDGQIINPVTFRKHIAYVMQDDALLATTTPREALEFSASMRLPASTTKSEIKVLVSKLLEQLGIAVCADVYVGGPLIKGISGGQRKRTSVGVELITSPRLLFLDEPTTGLDSFTSYALLKLLRQVATSCTILCTIHQPSSETFFLFDNVIVMKSGRIFYQGPPLGIIQYFTKFGYVCPINYNPADFVMSLSQRITIEEIESEGMFPTVPADLEENGEIGSLKLVEVDFEVSASFGRQIVYLSNREFTNARRDVGALIGRYGVTIVLNLLFGLIFLNVGGRDNGNDTDFNTHFGAIAMILIAGMFGSAQPILLNFPFERPLFLREYSTGTYGATAYFLSKLLIEIPMTFVQVLIQYILVYFMVNMQGEFIYIVLASFGLSMAASSVAVMLGCSVTNVKDATELAPLLFVPQMLFVGFFISTSQIPVFLSWAQYLCSLKYAMNLILITEFDLSNHSCNTSSDAHSNCQSIFSRNQIVTGEYYIYIILLFVIFAAFRICAAFILVHKAKRFY